MIKFAVLLTLALVSVQAIDYESFASFEDALNYEKSKYNFEANHPVDWHHFNLFKNEHNKTYDTHHEEQKRFNIFRTNLLKIKLLNALDAGTAVYGVNHLADLTEDEFHSKFTGATIDKEHIKKEYNLGKAEFNRTAALPKHFDWREKNVVTGVKDQGNCGSCWAFSTVGTVESHNKIVNGDLVKLSEQQLVDCDKRSHGCSGGNMIFAFKSIIEMGGLEGEFYYNYTGKDGECQFDENNVRVAVENFVLLEPNEVEIAQYVVEKGPVSVGLNARMMQFYKSGVSKPFPFLSRWMCNSRSLNHAIIIVGFGETKNRFGMKLDYWIAKNSWTELWGESGYYRVARGKNTCGIAQFVTAPIVTKQ